MTTLSDINFRDLGGLDTADGRRLRRGMLFRSQGPAGFVAAHKRELDEIGIRLVCDLRSEGERASHGYDLPGEVRYLHFDMRQDLRSGEATGWGMLARDPTAAGTRSAMIDNYASMPDALHGPIAGLFAEISSGQVPLLIHCTAGKDRTGVLVALLLTALGVERDEVLADYMRSEIFGRIMRADPNLTQASAEMLGFTPDQAMIDALIDVHPEYLEAALDEIDRRWGGVDAFLTSAGISGSERAAVRAVLLEPEPATTGFKAADA